MLNWNLQGSRVKGSVCRFQNDNYFDQTGKGDRCQCRFHPFTGPSKEENCSSVFSLFLQACCQEEECGSCRRSPLWSNCNAPQSPIPLLLWTKHYQHHATCILVCKQFFVRDGLSFHEHVKNKQTHIFGQILEPLKIWYNTTDWLVGKGRRAENTWCSKNVPWQGIPPRWSTTAGM